MSDFQNVLANIRGKHVYIQTHNFPDPDAIASAYGLANLLAHYRIEASICYKGEIERYSTADFVKKLGIRLTNLDEMTTMREDEEIILVDSQKGNTNIFDAPGEDIICIDHHPTFSHGTPVKYRYSDIRPELGACATRIAMYYVETGIEMDRKVATALLYGIKTDTMGLSRGVSVKDVEMFHYLYERSDLEIIQSLEHCTLQFEDLKSYARALNSIKLIEDVGFASTGRNCPEALTANISDFMLDIVEVDFSVVFSVKESGIKLSVRSMGNLDAGYVTNLALKGIGSGGGHASMAGGFVPLTEGESATANITELEERFMKSIRAERSLPHR